METFAEIVGVTGSLLYILAYALLQKRRDFAKTISYNAMNLIAAALIIFSCMYFWNTAAFIVNIAWLFLSMYGVRRCLKYKKDPTRSRQTS